MCFDTAAIGASAAFSSFEPDSRDVEDEMSGVVWVPMSRWKSSVGSEVTLSVSCSSSSEYGFSFLVRWGGITETVDSSFSFSLRRFVWAVSASSCRAPVRLATIGFTRNSLAPYRLAPMPAAPYSV